MNNTIKFIFYHIKLYNYLQSKQLFSFQSTNLAWLFSRTRGASSTTPSPAVAPTLASTLCTKRREWGSCAGSASAAVCVSLASVTGSTTSPWAVGEKRGRMAAPVIGGDSITWQLADLSPLPFTLALSTKMEPSHDIFPPDTSNSCPFSSNSGNSQRDVRFLPDAQDGTTHKVLVAIATAPDFGPQSNLINNKHYYNI
jgi:hypothetical protein